MASINFSEAQRAQVVRRYQRGFSAARIAATFANISPSVILRVLRAEGVEIRPRGRYAAETAAPA